MRIFKSIVIAFLGVLIAGMVVALVQQIGHALFETPAGFQEATTVDEKMELSKAWLPTAPFWPLAAVLISWVSGTFFGAWFAARFSRELPWAHAAPAICVMVLCTSLMLLSLPHPLWMNIAAILILPAGYAGVRLAGNRRDQEDERL